MKDERQQAEANWWRDYYAAHKGYADYYASRTGEYAAKTRNFPSFPTREGRGLDLGCGLVSVFDACDRDITCVDALMDFYDEIVPVESLRKPHFCLDGEGLPFDDQSFDYVICINMIDHTPHPSVLLDEVHRVLTPGGRLYFEVHFDDNLGAPHYSLWRRETVEQHLVRFHLEHEFTERLSGQWCYWAEYTR